MKQKSFHVLWSLPLEVLSFHFYFGKEGSKHLPFSSASATPLGDSIAYAVSSQLVPAESRGCTLLPPMEAELFDQTGQIWHFSLRHIFYIFIYLYLIE